MGKTERAFQKELLTEIRARLPGCIAFKVESYQQGFPDLIVLHKDKWAALECKRSKDSSIQNNQPYYVDRMNKMSFARFVYPENKEEVLDELLRTFGN